MIGNVIVNYSLAHVLVPFLRSYPPIHQSYFHPAEAKSQLFYGQFSLPRGESMIEGWVDKYISGDTKTSAFVSHRHGHLVLICLR